LRIRGKDDEKEAWREVTRGFDRPGQVGNSIAEIVCRPGRLECGVFLVAQIPILEFTNYDVYMEMAKLPVSITQQEIVQNIQIKMAFINSRYTDMQMAVRLTFMLLSLLVCIVYLCKICRLPRYIQRTSDQT
jgi:hypothetical protein